MVANAVSRATAVIRLTTGNSKSPAIISPHLYYRSFSAAKSNGVHSSASQNRIYDSVRDPASLQTLILLSSSSRTPLITLWKTSWCRSCAVVAPLIQSLVSSGATPNGAAGMSVGYAEVELDAPDMVEMGQRYSISSVPTLMAFDRQEAQVLTRVTDVSKLKDEAFLREWIDSEAARGGAGGAGGGILGS